MRWGRTRWQGRNQPWTLRNIYTKLKNRGTLFHGKLWVRWSKIIIAALIVWVINLSSILWVLILQISTSLSTLSSCLLSLTHCCINCLGDKFVFYIMSFNPPNFYFLVHFIFLPTKSYPMISLLPLWGKGAGEILREDFDKVHALKNRFGINYICDWITRLSYLSIDKMYLIP